MALVALLSIMVGLDPYEVGEASVDLNDLGHCMSQFCKMLEHWRRDEKWRKQTAVLISYWKTCVVRSILLEIQSGKPVICGWGKWEHVEFTTLCMEVDIQEYRLPGGYNEIIKTNL